MGPEPATSPRAAATPPVWSLLLLATVAWSAALLGPFQFDDKGVIVDRSTVHTLAGAWASFGHGLRPLLAATYALDWATGLGSAGFHATNLVLHLLNTLLVVRLYTAGTQPSARWGRGAWDGGTWVVALLFALHPLHTEAVTYISGRSVSLMTLFVLLSLLAYAQGVRQRSPALWLGATALAFAAALATKEAAATLPLALLGWDLLIERDHRRGVGVRAAAWGLVTALMLAAALLHDPTFRLLLDMAGQRPLGEAVVRQLDGTGYLLARLALLQPLSIDPGLGFAKPDPVTAGVVAVVLVLALGWAVRHRARQPLVAFGLGWWVLQVLAPYVFLPRVDVINERHAYLADAGLVLAAGALVAPWLARAGATWSRRILLTAAVGLAVLTFRRNLDYRTERALWEATVQASPDNPRAHHNLGAVQEAEGLLEQARLSYARALRREPHDVGAAQGAIRVTRRIEGGGR